MELGALCLNLAAIFAWERVSARAAAISTPIFFVAGEFSLRSSRPGSSRYGLRSSRSEPCTVDVPLREVGT